MRDPSGALGMFYTLIWVMGLCLQLEKFIRDTLKFGHFAILKNIMILSLNKFLKKLMEHSIGSHNRN